MLRPKSVSTNNGQSNGTQPHPQPASRELPMRVAYQGDRGAYAECAIAEIWRHPVEHVPVPTFSGTVRAVAEGHADACVIPVENSIVGRVDSACDALAAHPQLRIVGESRVA